MAVFDESKVINALHTDKAEIGKKYWFADNYVDLKIDVTEETNSRVLTLKYISDNIRYPFNFVSSRSQVIYPYEEPEKKLVPFTWEDREQLRGKWIKRNCEYLEDEFLVTGFYMGTPKLIQLGGRKEEVIGFDELFDEYTFLDGSTCGKVVEE